MSRVLVVGGNRGIGLAMVKQLSARGEEVITACRRSSKELSALDVEVIEGVDVRGEQGARKLSEGIGDRDLDLVVVVAGILKNVSLEALDYDAMREQFEVNALGPLRVAEAVMHRLGVGSKLALISSRMGSLEDNTSGGHYGYRMSKAALNMAGRSLAHDLERRGVTVLLLHPGFVRTEMTGHQGLIETDESAAGLIARVDALGLEDTGTFWHANGERLAF